MDPDRFQMKDIKRRLAKIEKKVESTTVGQKRRVVALRLEVKVLRQEIDALIHALAILPQAPNGGEEE